jgi:hypothetical protein
MAKFKNGNLIIQEGKKLTIGPTDITENSFTEVLSDAESYADSGDSNTLSTANSNIQFRAGDIRVVTSDSTAESGEILLVDASLGNVTIYVTPENNARITIKKIDSSSNQVRVRSAAGLIENFEKIALENQYENINILCDETNWWVVASTVTSREDLSLSSSSLSSSSSSSFNSNALPDWLSGFPVDSTSYIQVVIGTAWQYMSFDPGDTINLYKVSGQTIWTEDGTEIPNLTNRLKLRTYKNGGSWYLQVMGRPEDTSYIEFRANVQISFSAGFVGGDVYTFLDIFDKPVCKLRIYDWPGQEHDYLTVSIPPFIDYKGQIFQSMTFIDH